MAHTPGTWNVIEKQTGLSVESASGRRIYDFVGRCFIDSSKKYQDEERDNARLIAAAPDLLELCKIAAGDSRNLLNMSDPTEGLGKECVIPDVYRRRLENLIKALNDTIRKAEGK